MTMKITISSPIKVRSTEYEHAFLVRSLGTFGSAKDTHTFVG